MTYLLVFFTSLIITIFLTPFFISFLKRTKIVDLPGERKVHSEAMPRMGGLIIFLVVIIMLNAFVQDFNSIKLIIISSTILVFSGIIDDVLGLKNFIKFVVQNVSAIILVFYLEQHYTDVRLFGYVFTDPFDYLILLLFIVGAINSINLLDGLDGLASGFAMLIFGVLLVLAIRKNDVFLILLNVSLLGSILGFLRFNAFPASVFLGDTGSLVLGFFLVLSSLLTSINYHESALDLTFPLILLAVPIVDTIKVFTFRIIKKRDPFSGDYTHQHHILKTSIVSHEATVFIIELFSLAFIVLSILYLVDYRLEATFLFLVLSISMVALQKLLTKFKVADELNTILIRIHSYPIKNMFLLIKLLLTVSVVLMIFISIISFSFETSLNLEELIFLLIMVTVLLFLALFQSNKISSVGEVNIFLNFSIFFIISKLSLPSIFTTGINISVIELMHDWTFYIFATIISTTLLLRWKALMTKKMFFSGIDLTLIVIIILTFIVNNMLQFDLNYYLSISLLEAFIFYIWFRLVVDLNKKYEFILTLISFLLPISLLGTLIIFSLS